MKYSFPVSIFNDMIYFLLNQSGRLTIYNCAVLHGRQLVLMGRFKSCQNSIV